MSKKNKTHKKSKKKKTVIKVINQIPPSYHSPSLFPYEVSRQPLEKPNPEKQVGKTKSVFETIGSFIGLVKTILFFWIDTKK